MQSRSQCWALFPLAACRAVELHSHLFALERSGNLPRATFSSKVPLVEGPLSREEIFFLECVANEVLCPVELHYRKQSTASTDPSTPE